METIPYLDLGGETAPALLLRFPEKARALIAASRSAFGFVSLLLSAAALPIGDYFSRKWLEKTRNPYLPEIAAMAKKLDMPGVYALNLCYEWGCTSIAWAKSHSVTLTRVLDWPFDGLGRNMVVTKQTTPNGDYFNATWPGVAGVYQAMAPNRFAVTLNQAPMRRHRTDIVTDWVRNRFRLWKSSALPPSHLLRLVFETATNYAQAKHMLSTMPLALPVIYVLGGIVEGEGCIIERTENDCAIRELGERSNISAANHFESHLNGIGHGWLPRALLSHTRGMHAGLTPSTNADENFTWFIAPVANALSRLALVMDAKTSHLSLMGTEGTQPVTEIFHLHDAVSIPQ